METSAEDRMIIYNSLPEPKPDFPTFKRMFGSSNWIKQLVAWQHKQEGKKSSYLISGRFLFDDEDTALVFEADSYEEALELWETEMRDVDPDNENELITTIVAESETSISVEYNS